MTPVGQQAGEPTDEPGKLSNEQWDARLSELRRDMVDEKRALPQGYLSVLPFAIRAARERGYALAHHGSTARDLDLIAAPWTDDAAPPEDLAMAIAAATGTNTVPHGEDPKAKPHGRLCWSLHFHEHRTDGTPLPSGLYIDLSVMPRALLASRPQQPQAETPLTEPVPSAPEAEHRVSLLALKHWLTEKGMRSKLPPSWFEALDAGASPPEARADADEPTAREKQMARCLGFFASVIKSGEPWTEHCQREYDEALGRTPPPPADAKDAAR